jgi:hypothetical protein
MDELQALYNTQDYAILESILCYVGEERELEWKLPGVKNILRLLMRIQNSRLSLRMLSF